MYVVYFYLFADVVVEPRPARRRVFMFLGVLTFVSLVLRLFLPRLCPDGR